MESFSLFSVAPFPFSWTNGKWYMASGPLTLQITYYCMVPSILSFVFAILSIFVSFSLLVAGFDSIHFPIWFSVYLISIIDEFCFQFLFTSFSPQVRKFDFGFGHMNEVEKEKIQSLLNLKMVNYTYWKAQRKNR